MINKLHLPSVEVAHEVASLVMERAIFRDSSDQNDLLSKRFGSNTKLRNAVKKALGLIESSKGVKFKDLDEGTARLLIAELEEFVRVRTLDRRQPSKNFGKTLLLQLRDLQKVG